MGRTKINETQKARVKHLLLTTSAPLQQLAKRFGVSTSWMSQFSASLGLSLKSKSLGECVRTKKEKS